jgi:hypothetical protein
VCMLQILLNLDLVRQLTMVPVVGTPRASSLSQSFGDSREYFFSISNLSDSLGRSFSVLLVRLRLAAILNCWSPVVNFWRQLLAYGSQYSTLDNRFVSSLSCVVAVKGYMYCIILHVCMYNIIPFYSNNAKTCDIKGDQLQVSARQISLTFDYTLFCYRLLASTVN